MDRRIEEFVEAVRYNLIADEKMKARIVRDLYAHIMEACESESVEVVLSNMGSPSETAKEYMDSMYSDKEEVIDRMIYEKTRSQRFGGNIGSGHFEYKSKTRLFGLPLVHIKFRGGMYNVRPGVARGIIAIGDIAVGIISIGGLSIGILSIGGLAAGIFAFGGLALAVLLAAGGAAIGGMAFGGAAIGLVAAGGAAVGKIAIGGAAIGTVAIGAKPEGQFILNTTFQQVTQHDVVVLIKSAYPNLKDWIINLFTWFL